MIALSVIGGIALLTLVYSMLGLLIATLRGEVEWQFGYTYPYDEPLRNARTTNNRV